MKILINTLKGGGFSLSEIVYNRLGIPYDSATLVRLNAALGISLEEVYITCRCSKKLISIVEEIGLEKASGLDCQLEIMEIPDEIGMNFYVLFDHGRESLHPNEPFFDEKIRISREIGNHKKRKH